MTAVVGAPPYRVWFDEADGVTRCQWAPGSRCGLAEAEAVTAEVAALARAAGDRSIPLLVDMREMAAISRDAREHFAHWGYGVSAIALLAGSAVSRMIANFFIGLRKSQLPMRMFRSEPEALTWLAGFE